MKSANIRKLTSLVLVIALVLLPMAALAEATLTTVTISNFDVTLNDADPIHIDAQIQTSLGVSEAGFLHEGDITSDGRPVLHYTAAVEDDTVKLTADGVSSVYQITLAELEQLLQQSGGELPFDPQLLTNYVDAYMKLMQKTATMKDEKQNSVAAFEKAGIPMESKQESAEVLGETMELTRYDFELKAADFDRLLAVEVEQMPELKEFLEAYFALFGAVASQDGAGISFDKDHPFESILSSVNGDISAKCALWTDEAGDNLRMEFTEAVTAKDGDTTTTIEVPVTLMQKIDADGTVHMQMDMNMEAEGSGVGMQMLMNGNDDKGDLSFAMSVSENAQAVADIQFGMDYDVDAFNAAMAVNVPEGGDVTDVLFAMSCAPNGDVSRVELGLAVGQGEQGLFSGVLGFDVKCEEGALPSGPLMTSDKPVITISELTQEQLEQLQSEVTLIGYTSLGALMANPGIAKIMADATSAMISSSVETVTAVQVEEPEAVPEVEVEAPAIQGVPDAVVGG